MIRRINKNKKIVEIVMKIKNKILSYFLLIVFTAISFYFFTVLFNIFYGNRYEGIAWGFYLGIFFGQVLLSIFQREKFLRTIIKSIIYTLLLFGCLFITGKYLLKKFELNGWIMFRWFIIILLTISSLEISSYITNKSIFIARKIFK